jgi:hypothetical protein
LEHWSNYYGRRNDFRECCCHLLSFDHSTGAGHVIDRCGHGLPVVYTLLPFGEQGTKERNFFNPPTLQARESWQYGFREEGFRTVVLNPSTKLAWWVTWTEHPYRL